MKETGKINDKDTIAVIQIATIISKSSMDIGCVANIYTVFTGIQILKAKPDNNEY